MAKPTSITVLGILNLVLAGLGIMFTCPSVVSPLILKNTNPAMADLYRDPMFLTVFLLSLLLGLASKCLLGASGYGLLKGRAWGRRLGRFWAVLSMLLGLTLVVIALAYTLPMTLDAMEKDLQNPRPGQPPMPAGYVEFVKASSYASTIGGGLITALPYQITFLILINRKPVNDFFAGRWQPRPTAGPSHGHRPPTYPGG